MSNANQPPSVELERSPQARQLAERALVNLLHGLGEEDTGIVILGGLVPEVLTDGQEPPAPTHLGTTDVDLVLVTHLTLDVDLGHIERALEGMEFQPSDYNWRWRGGFGGPAVKIEFLCDLDTRREFEEVELVGCGRLIAQNLRGTGFVTRDWAWRRLDSTLADGSAVSVNARFAQLAGYLLSKLVAARTRGAEKDFYDLAYGFLTPPARRASRPNRCGRRRRKARPSSAPMLSPPRLSSSPRSAAARDLEPLRSLAGLAKQDRGRLLQHPAPG
jgi:hypothetical protein